MEFYVVYADRIFLSMWLELARLICALIIGDPAAYGLAPNPGRASSKLEELISLRLAVPGLALALLQLYGAVQGVRASLAFILVGHILCSLPFMIRSVLAPMAAMDLNTL